MNTKPLLLIVLFSTAFVGSSQTYAQFLPTVPTAEPEPNFLSEAQLRDAHDAALHGDAGAATKLSRYYAFFENDLAESLFWSQLAAESGECVRIKEFLTQITHIPQLSNPERIQIWTIRRESACKK